DESTRAEHDARPESSEEAPRDEDPGRDVEREVRHVLPRPVATQLAGRDRVIRDRLRGRPARFDAITTADPCARDVALSQDGGDGEAWTRVAAGAAARHDH